MKYFLLFIFCFLFADADAQQDKNMTIPTIPINKNLSKQDFKLSDICSDISYTNLEFDTKHPIAKTSRLHVTDKYIFFQSRSKILRYTKDGKRVQIIGSIGKGPGEYLEGSSFVLDKVNDKMYINVNFTPNVLVYDFDKNKYLNSFKIQKTDGYFLMSNSGVILRSSYTNRRYSSQYYSWELINSKGKIIFKKVNSNFIKPKSEHPWRGIITPSSLSWKATDNSFCSIYELGSDTIFTISDEFQVTPRFFIDSPIRRSGENATRFISESSQYLFWSLEDDGQKKVHHGVYDKTLKKSFIYSQNNYDDFRNKDKKLGLVNDIDGGLPVEIPFGQFSSTHWHFFVQPSDLIEYVNSPEFKKATVKNPKKKETLLHFVKTLQEDDNPVLVTLTIK